MAFRVGQKVVRIASKEGDGLFVKGKDYTFPAIGEVCTVRTINEWPKVTLITLFEHDNSHLIGRFGRYIEPGFDADCFRPIVEHKTDISVFTAMLNPSLEDVASHILQEVTLCP